MIALIKFRIHSQGNNGNECWQGLLNTDIVELLQKLNYKIVKCILNLGIPEYQKRTVGIINVGKVKVTWQE